MIKDINKTKKLVYIAFTVSISFVFSFIKIFRMPQGGSVSLEPLPIMWISMAFGTEYAIISGIILGILRALFGGYIIHPIQFLLDYPIAYGLLGIAGIFRKKNIPYQLFGIFLAFLLRLISHILSGIVFFASYTPIGQSVLAYSIAYNSSFLVPEFIINFTIWCFTFEKIKSFFIKNAFKKSYNT